MRADRHAHEYACLDFVLSGSVSESYKGRVRQTGAGRLLYYAPQAEHAWSAGRLGARILHAIVPTESLSRWELGRSECERELSEQGAPPLAYRMFHEFCAGDQSSALSIESSCAELIGLALATSRRTRRRPQWLGDIESMLRDEQSRDISLTTLADTVSVHPRHLARVFRRVHGCTPGQYLRRSRLSDASHRVLAGGETLASIAYRAGFSDQAHFTREFKRHIGCSPGFFRRKSGVHG